MKLSQLLKCYLLALLLNALPLSATAYDFMVDGLAYNITSDTSVSVAYAQEYSSSGLTTINIPDSVTYNGKTYLVVAIDRSAFSGCSSLVSVTIPNSVTSIGKDAFNNTAIYNNHPNGVFYVDRWVCGFKGNYYDSNIHLKSNTKGIADNAFEGKHFTNIEIPDSVAIIGKYAFLRCIDLVSISIPYSVNSIGMEAFEDCKNLTNIVLPVPNMLSFMGLAAFYGTPWYDNQLDGILYLGDWIYCYKGVMYYDTSLSIKNGTKGIAECAFANCNKLDSIAIPNTVAYICNYAFSSCKDLRSILSSIKAPDNVSMGTGVFRGSPTETCTLHVPKGTHDLYAEADEWKDFLNIIDDLDGPVIPGDVDGSGKVNVSDVTALINIILGIVDKDEQAADVNGDGKVNVSDVTALINIILGVE